MLPYTPRSRNTSTPPPSYPPPPPPSKNLPSLTRLSISSSTRSSSAASPPIKRKPLPTTALSPPQITVQPQSLQDRPPEKLGRSIAPASTTALNHILDSPTTGRHDLETPSDFDPQSYYFPTSVYSPDDFATAHQNITAEDFPFPPQLDHPVPSIPQHDLDHPLKKEKNNMGIRPGDRPPPLRIESVNSIKSIDGKKAQSPGSKFTAFFSRRAAPSPGAESSVTDISESKSALASPYSSSDQGSLRSAAVPRSDTNGRSHPSQSSQDSIRFEQIPSFRSNGSADYASRCNVLEAELREISIELAGSIRRELDLEDLVERLQIEGPRAGISADRTSDYFSDSGTSSIRRDGSEVSSKDEIDKVKRDLDQQRAALKVEMSQKWQDELSQRKTLESQVQILERKLSSNGPEHTHSSDSSTRVKELEMTVDDYKRRLLAEKKSKENFEDLLKALRVELEEHRNHRDNLRDEVVPQLQSRVEGLESTLAQSQKQPYDVTRMQQELEHLREENIALLGAREMDKGIQNRGSINLIAEEDADVILSPTSISPKIGGLTRSTTIHAGRANSRASLNRSGSLSRANSTAVRSQAGEENVIEKIKAIEQQRDALHVTVKYLLKRQEQSRRQYEKRLQAQGVETEKAIQAHGTRKTGYEREVRILRAEINTLRRRADDALEQKWQCEKGLSGLKMDLDRNKQETASLQRLLQARDSDPDSQEMLTVSLEAAMSELQKERVHTQESVAALEHEAHLSEQLEDSAARSEALAAQVKRQLQTNQSLRTRLKTAIEAGEHNQQASAEQINELQTKLRKLEDTITSAQVQSETAVMKHEEDIRVLNASNNTHLLRSRSGTKLGNMFASGQPSPLSPFFANSKKSPRLDSTSSGPGIPLHQALKTEYLENKVTELETALADAELEMEEVVGRMNTAQIGVAELQSERDEVLRQSRKLEESIRQEREKYKELLLTIR